MAEPLHSSPALAQAVGSDDPRLDGHGVTLRQAPVAAQVIVRAAPEHARRLGLPAEPNRIARAEDARAIWLGPDRWLVVSQDDAAPLLARYAPEAHDVSDQFAVLDIAGPSARRLLAAACGLDLHPAAFPEGIAAQTLGAHVDVLLYRIGADAFRLHVDRSVARHLWSWFAELVMESDALDP